MPYFAFFSHLLTHNSTETKSLTAGLKWPSYPIVKIRIFAPEMKERRHHIKDLISEGEHQMLDFKFEISDSKKIARSLAAFANTDGGRLLVGVKDNGAIAGVRSAEELHMIEAAAELYCQPPVRYSAKEWNVDGKAVVEVIIPKDMVDKHKAPDHFGSYKVFIRVADENLVADNVLVKVWQSDKYHRAAKITFNEAETLLLHHLTYQNSFSIPFFVTSSYIHLQIPYRNGPSKPNTVFPYNDIEDKVVKTIFIGRSSDDNYIINDPLVTRHHCKIEKTQSGKYYIENFGENGTRVNGRMISGKILLQPNDVIEVGNTTIKNPYNPHVYY